MMEMKDGEGLKIINKVVEDFKKQFGFKPSGSLEDYFLMWRTYYLTRDKLKC